MSITVTPVNDGPPVATNDAATVNEGASTAITVLANDTDPDGNATINPATVQVLTGPANGTTSVNTTTGVVTYQSNGAEVTSDSFTYTVKDNSSAVSTTATVNITITPVDDGPVVGEPGQPSDPDPDTGTVTGSVGVTDPDGDDLDYAIAEDGAPPTAGSSSTKRSAPTPTPPPKPVACALD